MLTRLERAPPLALKRRDWKQQEIAEALVVTPAAVSKFFSIVKQCLNRRIPTKDGLVKEVKAIVKER